jgi:hypothetical protein
MIDWDDDEPPPPSPEARRRVEIVFLAVFGVGVVVVFGAALGLRAPWSEDEARAGIRTEGGFLVAKPADAAARPRERELPRPPSTLVEDVRVSGFVVDEPTDADAGPGKVVERRPTPLTELQLAEVILEGHRRVFGRRATLARIGVAWAHLALEHKKGAAIECNNFGNLTVGPDTRQPHYVRRLQERTRKNAKAALGDWREVEMRFRAFETKEAGIEAYWRLLDRRYPGALAMFDVGNAHHAGRKLGEAGYATAYPQPYALSMAELQGEFRERVLPALRAKYPDYEAASLAEAGIGP